MPAERPLLQRLRQGDSSAFDELYASYRPRLFSFLARLTGQPALAEDLLQETFLRLAKAAPELATDTRISAWLFAVARNLFVSHRRWALLDLTRLSEARLWAKLRGPQATPFALASANETEQQLETAIARLPLRYREVVLLVALEQMSPSEAAEVLGLRPAATRQRLARARAMLSAHLTMLPAHVEGELKEP